MGRSSEAGGLGKQRCCCLLGRGRETHWLTRGGGQEGALLNQKCGHPTLGEEGYQGGRWGTRKPSPPTSKKEEEACNIQKGEQNTHLSGTRQGSGQPSVSQDPVPNHLRKSKLSTSTRLSALGISLPKNPTLAGSRRSSSWNWDVNSSSYTDPRHHRPTRPFSSIP